MATQGSDDDVLAETTTANEEVVDLIQQWKKNIDRDIVVVVAGKSNTGKSSLIT